VHSLLYSGTRAVKGDYVRTGKRQAGGLLSDAVSSLLRFFLNNLRDGGRQDAHDFVLGRWHLARAADSAAGGTAPPPPPGAANSALFATPPARSIALYVLRCTLVAAGCRAAVAWLAVVHAKSPPTTAPLVPAWLLGVILTVDQALFAAEEDEAPASWGTSAALLAVYAWLCWSRFSARVTQFTDKPRLLPGAYAPAQGAVLGGGTS